MTASRLRVAILQRLQSGPTSRGQLVAATGGTDNLVGHALKRHTCLSRHEIASHLQESLAVGGKSRDCETS